MNDYEAGPFQTRLSLPAQIDAGGAFEVLAITAGEGNGWKFSETALQESLALWDGANCFVDHAMRSRSVHDLAGVLADPVWDSERRGIRCRLRAVGPSGGLLTELGRQILEAGTPADENSGRANPNVGFSADILFTAQGRSVRKIVRVLSVDLVLKPARGGAFLRAVPDAPAPSTPALSQLSDANHHTPNPITGDHRMNEETITETIHSSLESAGAQEAQPAAPIEDPNAAAIIQGPARVSAMFSAEDRFTAALYDLLGAQRPADLAQIKTARLSGIRELYTRMTGDMAFAGGYDSEQAQFSTTADLPGVLKNAMNRLIVQEWQELGRTGYRWWEAVAAVEHFNSLQQVTGVLVGEVTVLPTVAEGDPYTPLAITDSSEIGTWTKYGGYIGLTLEMFERDETHRLRQFPRKLASAGLRRISSLVGAVFTANNGVGPNMSDGNPVFGAGRGNLGAAPLSAAAWEAASAAIYDQDMLVGALGTAPKLALDAKYLIVPRGLRLTGRQILYPSWEREVGIVSENMQRGEMGDVITCPEMSDPNDWAAAADPRLAPGIIIAERFGIMPEIIIADQKHNGALFTNDEIRMKARHWLAVFVADYRPLYKANVA